ncbi:transcription factor grauzone-like [Phlebotomus argentipes]|uniref:transcription factor grauzone-like n=1 Tax=Phlebotomus argentipes TaxID=94469 RepID=UPI0028932650|nr:transcription factor grauzone-like [Phlebotomus argentipes]
MDKIAIKQEFSSSSIICRLCLIQNSTYCTAFEANKYCLDIVDVLRTLLGISVSPMDNWPKSVCTACVELLNDFWMLLIKAKENEARLTEVFGEYKVRDDKILQETRTSPVFVSTNVKEEVKDEDTCISDAGDEGVSKVSRRKESKRVARKRKSPVPGQQVKDSRKTLDEKTDAEIHAFFKMECVLCNGLAFPRFPDLQKHFRAKHKRRGFVVCCGKKLKAPLYLQMHMQDHIQPVKHQCSVCLKFYKTTETLAKHKILVHTPVEEREFACDKCPLRFAVAAALKAHLINHTAPEDRKHICETCGQAFVTSHVLTEHVRRKHENSRNLVCEICAKVYRTKSLFEKHMAEHKSQLKPTIPCPICRKMFKHRVAMRNHKRCHDTSGDLQCQFCQHVSINRRALGEHVRSIHRRREVLQCSICDRVFKMRRSLREHMALHTGEVLYTCPYCSKEFNNNGNYFMHRKNAHPIEYLAEQEKRRAEQVFQKPELMK